MKAIRRTSPVQSAGYPCGQAHIQTKCVIEPLGSSRANRGVMSMKRLSLVVIALLIVIGVRDLRSPAVVLADQERSSKNTAGKIAA